MIELTADEIREGLFYLGFMDCWAMSGNDYNNLLLWESDKPRPTLDELKVAAASVISAKAARESAQAAISYAAIAHAKSLGFTDAMIGVMYPNLVTGAEPLVPGRESLNIPAKIDNNVTLDTVTP